MVKRVFVRGVGGEEVSFFLRSFWVGGVQKGKERFSKNEAEGKINVSFILRLLESHSRALLKGKVLCGGCLSSYVTARTGSKPLVFSLPKDL